MSGEKPITVHLVDPVSGRRKFLKGVGEILGGIALAGTASALLEACTGNGNMLTGGNPNNAPTVTVDVAGLSSDGSWLVTSVYDRYGAAMIVYRAAAGSFAVHSMKCTHSGCNLETPSGSGSSAVMQCPCHSSSFNVQGNVLGGPAFTSLMAYSATFNAAANTLTIKIN